MPVSEVGKWPIFRIFALHGANGKNTGTPAKRKKFSFPPEFRFPLSESERRLFFQIPFVPFVQLVRRRKKRIRAQKMRRFECDDLFHVRLDGFQFEAEFAPFDRRKFPRHIPVEGFQIRPIGNTVFFENLICSRHVGFQIAEITCPSMKAYALIRPSISPSR